MINLSLMMNEDLLKLISEEDYKKNKKNENYTKKNNKNSIENNMNNFENFLQIKIKNKIINKLIQV